MAALLEVGVSNEDVLDVQGRLMFLQLYHGHCDGTFTSTLGDAIVLYQQHVGADPTGTLDEPGLQHLREYTDHHGYGHQHHSQHQQHHHQQHQEHGRHAEPAVGDVQFDEGSTVHGGPGYYHHLAETLTHIQEHAILVAKLNDDAFVRACDEAKEYIDQQVAFYEMFDTVGGHVAMQVARSICDAVGIYVCSFAWPEVKWLAEQISMGISHSTSKISYSKVSGWRAAEANQFFHAQYRDLVRQVATMREEMHTQLTALFDPLFEIVKNDEPIPPYHEAWIARCYGSGGSDLDDVVEGLFGLRRPSRAFELENEVYQKVVEDFHVAWVEGKIEAAHASSVFPDRTPESERNAELFQRRQEARALARRAATQHAEATGHGHDHHRQQ